MRSVDVGGLDARLARTELVVLADVDSPLRDSARLYGPQKGLDEERRPQLESTLESLAETAQRVRPAVRPAARSHARRRWACRPDSAAFSARTSSVGRTTSRAGQACPRHSRGPTPCSPARAGWIRPPSSARHPATRSLPPTRAGFARACSPARSRPAQTSTCRPRATASSSERTPAARRRRPLTRSARRRQLDPDGAGLMRVGLGAAAALIAVRVAPALTSGGASALPAPPAGRARRHGSYFFFFDHEGEKKRQVYSSPCDSLGRAGR